MVWLCNQQPWMSWWSQSLTCHRSWARRVSLACGAPPEGVRFIWLPTPNYLEPLTTIILIMSDIKWYNVTIVSLAADYITWTDGATILDPVEHLDMELGPVWSNSPNYTKMAARFCSYGLWQWFFSQFMLNADEMVPQWLLAILALLCSELR